MEFKHVSVLLEETIDSLNICPDGIYVDGTTGGGGHSYEIAKRLGDKGRLICIDQDAEALAAARVRLAPFEEKITFVKSNYVHMKEVLSELSIPKVNGIVLDLGVSSYQLDNAERGFSYREDAPLDMRMDREQSVTAKDIVNEYPESELFRIIKEYGEERFAKIETTNATTIPITRISTSVPVNPKPNFTIFRRLAPNITGIPRKKVNSAATVREVPTRIPPMMVEPDLDVPGITEST